LSRTFSEAVTPCFDGPSGILVVGCSGLVNVLLAFLAFGSESGVSRTLPGLKKKTGFIIFARGINAH
jgi:hypothetical protein